jgi:hypothetical protein
VLSGTYTLIEFPKLSGTGRPAFVEIDDLDVPGFVEQYDREMSGSRVRHDVLRRRVRRAESGPLRRRNR